MKWQVLTQTVTGGKKEDPREFGVESHFFGQDRIFIIAAERVGGGNDDRVPRRALGIGTDRASAARSLHACVSRYDNVVHIVFPRERRARAGK